MNNAHNIWRNVHAECLLVDDFEFYSKYVKVDPNEGNAASCRLCGNTDERLNRHLFNCHAIRLNQP